MGLKIIENFLNIIRIVCIQHEIRWSVAEYLVTASFFSNERLLMSFSKTSTPTTVMTGRYNSDLCLAWVQRRARPLNCYLITAANLIMYYQLILSSNLSVQRMNMLKEMGKI